MIIQGSFLSVFHKNISFGYSLESPCRGDYNEYPQYRFLLRNKQNNPLIITKYPPYLFLRDTDQIAPEEIRRCGLIRVYAVCSLPAPFWNNARIIKSRRWSFRIVRAILVIKDESRHVKTCLMPYANNKDADQPAHPQYNATSFYSRNLKTLASLCGWAGRFES